jgi:hypothetical protein
MAQGIFQYQRSNPQGDNYGQQLYFAELALDPPMKVHSVSVHLMGSAMLEVFGLGLVDPKTGEVTQARDKARYQRVYEDQEIRVYENTRVMPRAFLVSDAVAAPRGRNPLGLMRDGMIDLRRSAVVECGEGAACAPDTLPRAEQPVSYEEVGSAHITARERDRVVVRASAASPAVLVLTDPYFPGWTAHVDGRVVPIIRADSLFRGVLVPSGDHEVTFAYEPEPVAIGAAATVGTALVLVLFFAIPELARASRRVRWAKARSSLAVPRPRWPALGRRPAPEASATASGRIAEPVPPGSVPPPPQWERLGEGTPVAAHSDDAGRR